MLGPLYLQIIKYNYKQYVHYTTSCCALKHLHSKVFQSLATYRHVVLFDGNFSIPFIPVNFIQKNKPLAFYQGQTETESSF